MKHPVLKLEGPWEVRRKFIIPRCPIGRMASTSNKY